MKQDEYEWKAGFDMGFDAGVAQAGRQQETLQTMLAEYEARDDKSEAAYQLLSDCYQWIKAHAPKRGAELVTRLEAHLDLRERVDA